MAGNELIQKVGADTKDFVDGMNRVAKEIHDAIKDINELSVAYAKGDKTLEQFRKETGALERKLNSNQKALAGMQRAGKGVGSALSANAIPATQEFSRVIQDAPYGIQGVANNIQQLTAQFGYLSAKSGGAKNALKAMVSSLAGPAGILLAVSLVTAAMVQFGPAIAKFITGQDSAEEQAKQLTKRLEDQKKAQDELRKSIQETTTAQKTQVKLIGEIFGDSAESIYEEQKVFDSKRLLDLQKLAYKQQQIVKETNDEAERIRTKGTRSERKSLKDGTNAIIAQNKQAYELFERYSDDIAKLKRDIDTREKKEDLRRNDESAKDFKETEEEKTEAFKKEVDARTKYLEDAYKFRIAAKKAQAGVADFRTEGPAPKSDEFDIAGGDWVTIYEPSPLLAAGERLAEAARTNGEKLSGAISEGATLAGQAAQVMSKHLEKAFVGIGELIGDVLSGGADHIEISGKKLLNSFGQFLGEMGKMAIAYGSFMLAMELASKIGGIGGALAVIGAGVAMVAIGKVIANKTKEAPAAARGASGGSVAGGGSSSFSGSSSTATSSGSGGGTYVFEIEGTKLVGVLSNTLRRNKALGGSNLNFI